jgi:4-amino-4-deoxy-L-arabinose transferase-like glycosyltransferase
LIAVLANRRRVRFSTSAKELMLHTCITGDIRRQTVATAVVSAFFIRILLLFFLSPTSHVINLTKGYIETAAAVMSGKGLIMPAGTNTTIDVIKFLKSREDVGRRVTAEDPFPPNASAWVPAMLHPPGYSLLLALLYRAGNITSMFWWVLRIQVVLDAFTCLLVYVFVRNLFGADAGLVGAWIYALLPSPMLLSLQILPDGLSCFFAAAILACASYIGSRGLSAAVATGAILGIASLFRAELLLWSPIVVLLLAISPGKIANKVRCSSALALTQVATLMPWILWTYQATGHVSAFTGQSGAAMYESLGESPNNPWRITMDDGWVEADAERRGLTSAWTPEADAYYRKMFLSCVQTHPGSFVHLLVTQRLPLAVAPAYYMGGDMWFASHRLNEGLTRWQTLRKHLGSTIRHEALKLVMALLSALLLLVMVYTSFLHRRTLRTLSWLWLPWIVTTGALILVKQVESRNLASNLIVEVAAAALLVSRHSGRLMPGALSPGQRAPRVPPRMALVSNAADLAPQSAPLELVRLK